MGTRRPFSHHVFRGSHREVGRQHGEALRNQIHAHLEIIYARGLQKANLDRERVLELAVSFTPFVRRYSPDFLDEVEGIAEGAGIQVSEAMLLQVRQEVANIARFGLEMECTTFAVSAPYTRDGSTIAGQNADLSGPMEEISAVLTFDVPGKPKIMMLIPAGQISYIGMNAEGLTACANFLHCKGWRPGYPRYMLTRLALEKWSLEGAVQAALTPERASTRNLLLAHRDGGMVDIETTVSRHGRLRGQGCLTHTNHFVIPEMTRHEGSTFGELDNSRKRLSRMKELLEAKKGEIDLAYLQTCYRDHGNFPDSICAHPSETDTPRTFASMINLVGEGKMVLAKGPPCQNEYVSYTCTGLVLDTQDALR